MTRLLRRLALSLLLLGFAPAVQADQPDVAAAARGVVRVVLAATDGSESYFVGHGSGFAVAPDKVITNAHVVEITRQEKNIVIGIIPSQGRKSYGGHVIAYSPGNDLALIQLDEGSLPVETFFAGAVTDGQQVVAIGYPGTVDRAQGLSLEQMIEPVSPVKTSGNVSSGRSAQQFDTILHTAPMAAGNSGGPLVDDCGRVLGVNSFGSVSDGGNDAEFGFAVSNREVASFLRQAGVTFRRTAFACKSMSEMASAQAQATALDVARQDAASRASDAAKQVALQKARDAAVQDIISARENAMAVSAVLLAIAVLALGACGLSYTQGRKRAAIWTGIGGGGALLIAGIIFFTRPSFADIDRRIAVPGAPQPAAQAAAYIAAGDNICRLDTNLSRVTVSEPEDVGLNWTDGGCVNGRTQFARDSDKWARILVPASEQAVSVNSFDPRTGTYMSDHYLLDGDTFGKALALRAGSDAGECSANPDRLRQLAALQQQIRTLLPPQPNEKLIFHCSKGKLERNGTAPGVDGL